MPRVESLTIYPVKGVAGVSLEEATIERRGLRHDRRFIIVDAENSLVSQRQHSILATLEASIGEEQLSFKFRGGDAANVPIPNGQSNRLMVKVWFNETSAADCGDEIAQWLSNALDEPVRLAYMDDQAVRAPGKWGSPGDEVSFADAYPVMIAGSASLAELNSRLESPIPMNRFRPNIVVSGFEPWAEDGWTKVRIGDVTFRGVAPDIRCQVTTIDQETGEKTGKEPLATLATYRKIEGGVVFGRYLIPDTLGTIRIGDEVLAS